MLEILLDLLSLNDANVRYVLLGSLLIGGTGGLLGSFAVLRKRSLIGDALAHAALPGVGIAFILTGSKSLFPLLVGASISGVIGVLIIQMTVQYTRIKADAAIGIVLSVFFGLGIVLLTHIQRSAVGNQSGLDKFLFGQAASIVSDDLKVMSILAAVIIVVVLFFYKEFKCLIFDPDYLSSLGFSTRIVDLVLMALIVLTVMVGLQAVGVVLIAAMLITPAVAARFWTDRLNRMICIASFFGGASGVIGTLISSLAPRIPTGPVMVMVVTAIFILSALLAPKKGMLARWRRLRANQRREDKQHLLRAMIELGEKSKQSHKFNLDEITGKLRVSKNKTRNIARQLKRQRLVTQQNSVVSLTKQGMEEAGQVVKSHRLWEHYLVYRSILKPDHVDRPADEVEHILTPEIITELEEILKKDNVNTKEISNIHETESGYRERGQDD